MITVITRFPLPDVSAEEKTAMFEQSVSRYQTVPGLIRKYYYLDEDGSGGGVYLFENKDQAQALFGDAFRKNILERFGAEPQVTWLDTVLVIDNRTGTVEKA